MGHGKTMKSKSVNEGSLAGTLFVRLLLTLVVLGTAAVITLVLPKSKQLTAITATATPGPLKQPELPYALNALEPHISEEAVRYHYFKHHRGYYNKLNAQQKDATSLKELIKTSTTGSSTYNLAAQAINHDYYWTSLSPVATTPSARVQALIKENFGSFEAFQTKFNEIAGGHFGSGWAWILFDKTNSKLSVEASHDALTFIGDAQVVPLAVCDVWEHAYYVDYRNDRASYINSWWSLLNW